MSESGFDLSVESVLESVIEITEQRSRANLERCICDTLLELAACEDVRIAQPVEFQGEPHLEHLAARRRDGRTAVVDGPVPLADHPHMAEALRKGQEVSHFHPEGRWLICVPVLDPRHVAVAVLMAEGGDVRPMDHALVRGIASVYRNYLEILRDAERDTLTGLRNRKTFDDNLGQMISTARRGRKVVKGDRRSQDGEEHNWLAICDIDHFKQVNDTWGHIYGDEILILFATLMRKVFRAEDLLFRFGGEEFVVVLSPTAADCAQRAFERFRATVEGFDFPQVGRVTVSVGFVRIHPDDVPSEVLGRADEALYQAKESGRNRVFCYESLDLDHSGPGASVGGEERVELF